ncbi:hypothetical protein ACIOFV_39815 [Streptomyces mirabilis]|uniref:MmyB family transcriptional regulator n=1 Tax=Streptomyces TaxID=1883 RepID=UPI000AFC1BCF
MGPAFDILATNAIADALLSPFKGETSTPRILFTHPRDRNVFRDLKLVASATVYALHLMRPVQRRPRDQRPGPGTAGLVR